MFIEVWMTDMNECQAGAGPWPPVTSAMGWLSSLPNQMLATYLPVKPMNHASLYPDVVPVLPTTLVKSRAAALPVPCVTTISIIWFICSTTLCEITCGAGASSRSRE